MVVEDVRGIRHVGHLFHGSPTLARPLLEESDGIQITIGKVRDSRFLHGRGDGHRRRMIRQSAIDGDVGDELRVLGLFRHEGIAWAVGWFRRTIGVVGGAGRGAGGKENAWQIDERGQNRDDDASDDKHQHPSAARAATSPVSRSPNHLASFLALSVFA